MCTLEDTLILLSDNSNAVSERILLLERSQTYNEINCGLWNIRWKRAEMDVQSC